MNNDLPLNEAEIEKIDDRLGRQEFLANVIKGGLAENKAADQWCKDCNGNMGYEAISMKRIGDITKYEEHARDDGDFQTIVKNRSGKVIINRPIELKLVNYRNSKFYRFKIHQCNNCVNKKIPIVLMTRHESDLEKVGIFGVNDIDKIRNNEPITMDGKFGKKKKVYLLSDMDDRYANFILRSTINSKESVKAWLTEFVKRCQQG